MSDLNKISHSIYQWADITFPARGDASMFLKLYGEIAELISAGDDCADEIADILILVLDYSIRKGVDPELAIREKMAINFNRKWIASKIGVMQHVE